MLSKFLQGASVGRARADAQKYQQQAMRQQQDIQNIQKFVDQAALSGKDPEAIEQAQHGAIGQLGQWVVRDIGEAAKGGNKFMGFMHEAAIQLMGGHPADEGTRKDPKTGKTIKTKTEYQSGLDPEKMLALYTNLQNAPTKEQAAQMKSDKITTEAKALIDKAQATHPNTPVTLEEAKGVLAASGLDTQSQSIKGRYGIDPLGLYIDSFTPKPTPREQLELEQAEELRQQNKMYQEMFPASRTAGQPGPPQAAITPPEQLDPQKLFALSRAKSPKVKEGAFYLLDKPNAASGKYVNLYETEYGYYDKSGKYYPPDQVLDKAAASARNTNKWQLKTIEGVLTRVNPETGEAVPMTWPGGRPMRPTGVNYDPLNKAFQAQNKFDDHIERMQLVETQAKDALDKEHDRKDADGNPYMTEKQYQDRMNGLSTRFRQLREQEQQRFNNKQRFFEAQTNNQLPSIGSLSGSNVVERNQNPLALKVMKDGVGTFKTYADPTAGIKEASDLIDKYNSPKGLYGVNEDSSLLDLMGKWAPWGDGDNDPPVYADYIAKQMKLPDGVDTKLKDLRARKPEMMKVMAGWEGGKKFLPDIDKFFGIKPTATAPPPATPYKEFDVKSLLGGQ